MSERIEIILPKTIYDKLEKIARENNISISDLILRAIVELIESEST